MIKLLLFCSLFPFFPAINSISCEYDVPRPALETYDTPRLVVNTNGTNSPPLLSSTTTLGDEYDVPVAPTAARLQHQTSNNQSDRSSGVSLFSSGSSESSSAISNINRSVSSESLSLSSAVGRISGRSSRSSVIDQQHQSFELYDVPPSNHQPVRDAQTASRAIQEEVYDVPKPTIVADDSVYDVPQPTAVPSSVVPDIAGQELYDIPPTRPVAVQEDQRITLPTLPPPPEQQSNETYDCPKPLGGDWADKISATLPLSLDAALETLSRLDAEVTSALCNLLGFWRSAVGGDWAELQLRVLRLRASLQELCDFALGAIGNAARRIKNGINDQDVAVRLARLLRPLQDANTIVQKTSQSWTDLFATSRRRPNSGTNGELEQLLACCRNLGDDMRQVMTTHLVERDRFQQSFFPFHPLWTEKKIVIFTLHSPSAWETELI